MREGDLEKRIVTPIEPDTARPSIPRRAVFPGDYESALEARGITTQRLIDSGQWSLGSKSKQHSASFDAAAQRVPATRQEWTEEVLGCSSLALICRECEEVIHFSLGADRSEINRAIAEHQCRNREARPAAASECIPQTGDRQ